MPVSVTVHITGTNEEIAKFQRLGTKLHDFSKAMSLIGDEVIRYYDSQVFASQGGILGTRWASLNPIYAKNKAKRYPGRGILVKTGNMQRSFVARTTHESVEVTNTAPYFKYHQSSESRSKMPYRPMMSVNSGVEGIIKRIIKDDIAEKIATL